MLTPPGHVAAAGVIGAPVVHKWVSDEHFDRESNALDDLFDAMSIRAVLAAAAGVAEWIAWRFHGIADVTANLNWIEATWAAQADPRYAVRLPVPGAVPTDPVGAPLAHADLLLRECYGDYVAASTANTQPAVYLTFLARHVLPKGSPFTAWLKPTLKRLGARYPYDEAEPLGPPVPRAAMEPGFAGPDGPALNAFLAACDPAQNVFLRSAADLARGGLPGTPYTV